jgi:hypothetical protein
MNDPDKNIQQEYYDANKDHLEERFPDRKKGDSTLYLRQNFIVFGSAIVGLLILLFSKIKFQKKYGEVAGPDVSITACLLNLIFAYAFGFVAVVNDWWFFFPDSITRFMWHIPNAHGGTPDHGYMVLGDIVFYILATIMGHLAVIFILRISKPISHPHWDALGKLLWFTIFFTVGLFGITFGSRVMQGMVTWLYLPFGLFALLFYKKYTAFQIWFPTALFIVCEFAWDAFARIKGVWIFPDATTHPGLYIPEITLFHAGRYPIIWQPEMTMMAFGSGMICLVFFFLARVLVREDAIC